ncbi:hypothetical protein MRB53_005092 [Persea americana]|uniref:Uncharacterized protein n=1 Tax=Persea americana TaxID=3435 RepID=A0ACC2MCA4_PERAE|nr:hypothetical protein MRB53_005092 [Persea americana]
MAKQICKKLMLVLVALVLFSVQEAATTAGRKILTDLEIRKELRRLNKPAIKIIKSEDGDIIDCVDIYKQPAFDHPLLENHTIQMRPSIYNGESTSSSKPLEQLWHKSGSCPQGTIPIQRAQKRHLLGAISLDASQLESSKVSIDDRNKGGAGIINVWNIHVEPRDFSKASIFVGRRDNFDLIDAGWIVSRSMFGDDATRLYGFWGTTSDNLGCYNLKCPGFVQVSQKIALGTVFTPTSVYGGLQKVLDLKIFKDKATSNWWLVLGDESVGYWPSSLFKNMADHADYVQWGGQVLNTAPGGSHTSTQMGSGHFPNEGFQKAAFFDKCVYFYTDDIVGMTPYYSKSKVSKPACYDVSDVSVLKGTPGVQFFYGGPGGPNCS